MKPLAWLLISLLFVAASCSRKEPHSPAAPKAEALSHSKYLRISLADNYSRVQILDPADTNRLLGSYIFAPNDSAEMPLFEGTEIIRPGQLKRLLVYSTVHAAGLKETGGLSRIISVGDAPYFTLPEIKQGLKDGRIADAGMQQEPVTEKILASKPGLIILSYYEGLDASKLEKLGIPILYMCESCEQTPLGRAEWIKLLGLVSGNPSRAEEIFRREERAYTTLKNSRLESSPTKLGDENKEKPKPRTDGPTVLTEWMYQGVWNLAGGDSYAARLIEDAGGRYLWADTREEKVLFMPFEAVLSRAAHADIWLLRSFGEKVSPAMLKQKDSRYGLFDVVKGSNLSFPNGGIWYCDTKDMPYYETTTFHPSLVLEDYIAIFSGKSPVKTHFFKRAQP